MSGEWKEHIYHGYVVRGRIVPFTDGDYEKWVAEVFSGEEKTLLFQFRFIISRTELIIRGLADEAKFLEEEGLRRLHARLDFGEFVRGEEHNHELTTTSEETTHPFHEPFADLFHSRDERLAYHILKVLWRLSYESPGRMTNDGFDSSSWAYYLNVTEEDIIPVLRRLSDEGVLKTQWISSPKVYGALVPIGELGITSTGLTLLEVLENELVERRRTTVMPDLEEDAFQIARAMYDNKFIGASMVVVADLKQMVNLSAEDFDAADNFLRGAFYCGGTTGGDAGRRWLKPAGIAFVTAKLSERFELSYNAERVAKYLAQQHNNGKPFVVASEILASLTWDNDKYSAAAQELVDEGLAEEKPQADNARFLGLALTSEGRRAARRNFRRSTPAVSIQTGDSYKIESHGDRAANLAYAGLECGQA